MSDTNKSITLYNIKTYKDANKKFITKNGIIIDDVEEAKNYLKSSCGYHFRIHKNTQYIFFGDLDNYEKDITEFIDILKNFMFKQYDLTFDTEDFKYTQNNIKKNSYHYTIPKWNASTEKLKEIHTNLLDMNKKYFTYKDKTTHNIIDTTIYSEHWFRCPNQKKGTDENDISKHVIICGNMEDFIVEYIPENSVNINEHEFIQHNKKILIKNNNIIKSNNDIKTTDNETTITKNNFTTVSSSMNKPQLYKKMFDNCYKQERFEVYEYWVSVGMAIKNTFDDENMAFDLFNYFSSKGSNYDGINETKSKFQGFKIKKDNSNKYTVATIYYFAIEDNKPKFIEIMKENTLELGQHDMCKYMKMLAGKYFFYSKVSDNDYRLYCFNGKTWNQNDILFKNYLSTELYDFLKTILVELYFEHSSFNQMTTQLKKLKSTQFKNGITETYKEVNINDTIKFDNKWNLFGFNNKVYDLLEESFRDYKYDDYISITTGYDWREPTIDEIDTINDLISKIMPIKEERDLYLQILSTSLEGRCLENFLIFCGSGGNGKGMLNDLLLYSVGNYGMTGNNSILFETNKTGSNPEKAQMHKKRLVIFREPPENKKFENSIIKELTGGGSISARGLFESNIKKELHSTLIIECNKKPLFSEEPTDADIRRIIDIQFRSSFTQNKELLDDSKYIYEANIFYKTDEFKEKYKFALLKILMDAHKIYKNNNYIFTIPKTVEERTRKYLEMSYNILQWFKENYEYTNNPNDICRMIVLYNDFTKSIHFTSLTKTQQKKYNKSYFNDFIVSNKFFQKYHNDRYKNICNCLVGWKKIEEGSDSNSSDD